MDTFRKILGTHFHVLKNEDMKNLDFILQLQLKQSLALGVVSTVEHGLAQDNYCMSLAGFQIKSQ